MTLYEACVILGVWPMAKAHAQVWSMSSGDHSSMLDEFKAKVKDKFRELALKHHPDKGGNNDEYVKIQFAHELVKASTVASLIWALESEKQASTKYYDPGSSECGNCSKWSDLVHACSTSSCTGFSEHSKRNKSRNTSFTEINYAYSNGT